MQPRKHEDVLLRRFSAGFGRVVSNRNGMGKAFAATVMLGYMVAGCDRPSERFPEPAPLRSQLGPDPGFPIKPRPGCSAAVLGALRDPESEAIARVASQGGDFTCGPAFDPTPLDEAVMNDAPALVRALLEARADPNARWSSHGDRFPLQDAIEARAYGWPHTHRAEIVRLLLRHGADPNSRWCPFESRGTDAGLPPCNSKWGVTPLIMAAALDQADVTYLLLDARADPTLADSAGGSALDYARSEAVFELLLPPLFPNAASRESEAMKYLTSRNPTLGVPGPWNETPLARAIAGGPLPSLPPPPSRGSASVPSLRAGRVNVLLRVRARNDSSDVGGVVGRRRSSQAARTTRR